MKREDKLIHDFQERAFWRVQRPPVRLVSYMYLFLNVTSYTYNVSIGIGSYYNVVLTICFGPLPFYNLPFCLQTYECLPFCF